MSESSRQSSQQSTRNLWDIASIQAKENKKSNSESETHLLFVGPKNAGKTTLLHKYMKKSSSSIKPTIGMSYTYGRKESGSATKVAHFWDLGGGMDLLNLVDNVIIEPNLPNIVIVIVVDLSKPWKVVEELFDFVREIKKKILSRMEALNSKGSSTPKKLVGKMRKNIGKDHPDLNKMSICGVPIMLITNKYDQIDDNIEPDQRRLIFRTLRYIAHVNGASVVMTSASDDRTITKFSSILNYHVFESSISVNKLIVKDHKSYQPLTVLEGKDSFENIGKAPSLKSEDLRRVSKIIKRTGEEEFDKWQSALKVAFPRPSEDNEDNSDQVEEARKLIKEFPEEIVDKAIADEQAMIQMQSSSQRKKKKK